MSSKRTAGGCPKALPQLLAGIGACRICLDTPRGRLLPHEPRPVLRASTTARIAVCGQAPGTRVHASGIPFTDPSGDRLRSWMGVTEDEFYDTSRIAIVPMGFCFPGLDAKGGDLPPRKECAAAWHERLFKLMPQIDVFVLVGLSALRWHIPELVQASLTETVAAWRALASPIATRTHPHARVFPAPHPSWRNTGWLKKHPWFAQELLPELQNEVRRRL
jgi:uracil-DNA glycosylase